MKGESIKQAASSAFAIQVITVNHAPKHNVLIPEKTWKKPQPGSYKLNTDACFFEDGTGAVPAILHNCRGEAIAGASETFDHAYNAQPAEALALRRGLQMIFDMGCSKVEVESNCLELMDACNGKMDIQGPNSALLADCFHSWYYINLFQLLSQISKHVGTLSGYDLF